MARLYNSMQTFVPQIHAICQIQVLKLEEILWTRPQIAWIVGVHRSQSIDARYLRAAYFKIKLLNLLAFQFFYISCTADVKVFQMNTSRNELQNTAIRY